MKILMIVKRFILEICREIFSVCLWDEGKPQVKVYCKAWECVKGRGIC